MTTETTKRKTKMSASELLERAADHLKDRAATYDKPDGERSIGATVKAFNAITGDGAMNSEERGWLFMTILKMVRTQQGDYKADNYEDGAAYFALAGEAACEERNGGWTPQAIEAAAFRKSCDRAEYMLGDVVGGTVLNDWARWVAVDADGSALEYSKKPEVSKCGTHWASRGKHRFLHRVDPPADFRECIWRV